MPPAPLTHIGKYRILELVGEGAMGVVYRAEDTVLRRVVAVKVMSDAVARQNELRGRFLREAQAAGSLQHPNVVTVYDFGEVSDHLYIAMEFVAGEDLAALLAREAPLTLAEKLDIAIDVLTGLAYAHRHGIVHRDVKPANIRVGEDGRAKIMDFGVARLEQSNVTQTGMMVGTPSYMAPEQVTGGPLTPVADVFAFGAVLHELLTGVKPFDGPTLHAILYKIVSEVPPPPSQLVPGLPAALDRIVTRALAKDPAARYPNALEMANELSAVRASLSGGLPKAATVSLSASLAGVTPTPMHAAPVAAPTMGGSAAGKGPRTALLAGAAVVVVVAAAAAGSAFARRGGGAADPASTTGAGASGGAPQGASPAAGATGAALPAPPGVPSGAPSGARTSVPPAATASRTPPATAPGGARTGTAAAPAGTGGTVSQSSTSVPAPAPQGTSPGAPRGASQGTPQSTPQGAPQGAPQRSLAQAPGTALPTASQPGSGATSPTSAAAVTGAPPTVTPTGTAPVAPPPAAPPVARPAVAAPAADPKEIPAVVEAYARAIESRDVAAVRRAYPGLTAAQQHNFEQFFDYARTVRVTFSVAGLEANGPTAEVRVVGAYDYATAAGKRERQPVSFGATVRYDGASWRLVAVR